MYSSFQRQRKYGDLSSNGPGMFFVRKSDTRNGLTLYDVTRRSGMESYKTTNFGFKQIRIAFIKVYPDLELILSNFEVEESFVISQIC